MNRFWAVFIIVVFGLLLVGTAAFAESENSWLTTGLSGVAWTQGTELRGSVTWYFYEWTVSNLTGTPLTDSNGKKYQVLIDTFSIFNQPFGLPDPMDWDAPAGWTLMHKNQFERYVDTDMGEKYYVPPSVGPGSSLSGYRFYYDYLPVTSLDGMDYITHVLAVDPTPIGTAWSTKYQTWQTHYAGVTVSLPGNGNQNTWWDLPGTPQIPEATAIMLGITGLGGVAAFRRFRK